jgi:hypothetical protein
MKPITVPLDQAALDRKRELDIKEREVAAREIEVAATADDLKRNRWLNPTVIGLFAAALGLAGSFAVARANNENTQQVERLRSQSNLILEAIKTGSPDKACQNLVFFVGLGLVDDTNQTIQKKCSSSPAGAPSLPAASPQGPEGSGLTGSVGDAVTAKPIENATVLITGQGVALRLLTDKNGNFELKALPKRGMDVRISFLKDGYKSEEMQMITPGSVYQPLEPIRK